MTEEIVNTFSISRKNSNRSTSSNVSQDNIRTLTCPKRTEGDGMEFVNPDKFTDSIDKSIKIRLGEALIYHPTNLKQQVSTPPVTPTGQIVNLVPKNHIRRDKQILHPLKIKEPKFVPYEPYKAAVNPIVPIKKMTKKVKSKKNNLDINVMVSQLAQLKTEEIKKNSIDLKANASIDTESNEFNKQLEDEVQRLKEENTQLENQLKFQAQVNGELKNLLVAAVGEDLQTRVNLLTEDKLQLAQALLNSAKHLSTHQEQTEWLAGQCEVWRSKFLASSLMVEELAKWKAALHQRTSELNGIIGKLLEEHSSVRDTSLKTFRNLSILRENFDPIGAARGPELSSTNVMDLTNKCQQLSESLKTQLLSGMENIILKKEVNTDGLETKTISEKKAEQLLQTPALLMSCYQDVACSAVMGAATAVGSRKFSNACNNPEMCSVPGFACCGQCTGEIKQI
ncbi:golgin-45 [Trichogramma pretiosum]|uniref:golgin-45 n=1 Tax=Trichogramma pretiosum TaxID=7493 RepID=UPI0006C97C84|nr:golgin-45 [Trichogramma pretiosum]